MIADLLERFLRLLGYVPAREEASVMDFESQLAMLFPAEEDREAFRQGMLMFAKVGATWEDIEQALPIIARGQSARPSGDGPIEENIENDIFPAVTDWAYRIARDLLPTAGHKGLNSADLKMRDPRIDELARVARLCLESPDFSYGMARKRFNSLVSPELILDLIEKDGEIA